MLNLRQFDLWAWATYTDTQNVAMLLGAIPPKLDRQHERAWVLLTFLTCAQLIYSLQSHTRLTKPSVSPVPSPLSTSPFPPHQTTSIVKYVRAHLTNTRCSSVTYVTWDGIWTAFSQPLPLFHIDSGNAPYVSHATSFPIQPLSTFAFLPPSSISTLLEMLLKNKMTLYLYSALPGSPLPQNKTKTKTNKPPNQNLLPNTHTCILAPHPHTHLIMTGLRMRPKFST